MNKLDINPIIKAKQVHKCSICKKNFYWNDESYWYGIEEDKKGNRKILEKTCSTICFQNSKYKDK